MSICFHPYVHDQIRDIWIVPRAVRDDPDSFELSVSNANGVDLLSGQAVSGKLELVAGDVAVIREDGG